MDYKKQVSAYGAEPQDGTQDSLPIPSSEVRHVWCLNSTGVCPFPGEPAHYGDLAMRVEKRLHTEGLFAAASIEPLFQIADYLTLGVDVLDSDSDKHAEMVATIDLRNGKVVAWTGKSYPVEYQKRTLLYCAAPESHFQTINGRMVFVLGCHDLNMFNPRAWGTMNKRNSWNGYKGKTILCYQDLCKKRLFHGNRSRGRCS